MQHSDNDPHRLNGQKNQHWKLDYNKRAMAAGQKQPGEAEKAKQDEWDESATNIRLHHAKGRGDETGEPKKVISQPSGWLRHVRQVTFRGNMIQTAPNVAGNAGQGQGCESQAAFCGFARERFGVVLDGAPQPGFRSSNNAIEGIMSEWDSEVSYSMMAGVRSERMTWNGTRGLLAHRANSVDSAF